MAVAEDFTRIVSDWIAAHILRATVVILRGEELWDYPVPVGTWDEWVDATKSVDSPSPVIIEVS